MNLYIVTGTTRGLGQALAEAIAADSGNFLVALARAPSGPIAGGVRVTLDASDTRAIDLAFDAVEREIAGKGFAKAVLINNAGVIPPVGPLEQVAAADIERNLVVNLLAPMLLMRRFLLATPAVPLRRIVNISSGAARRPIFGWSAYCTAKAGLDMASRAVALEAQSRGMAVEVSSLAPGVIDTGMQETVRAASVEQFADVEKFRALKAEGVLRPARAVAEDLLRLEAAGRLAGDPIQDLRTLA